MVEAERRNTGKPLYFTSNSSGIKHGSSLWLHVMGIVILGCILDIILPVILEVAGVGNIHEENELWLRACRTKDICLCLFVVRFVYPIHSNFKIWFMVVHHERAFTAAYSGLHVNQD